MKHWFLVFSFLGFVSFSLSSSFPGRFLDSEEEKGESILSSPFLSSSIKKTNSCLSTFKKVAFLAADKSALLAVAALGAWGGSEWVGQQTNTPLVGLSIYLDYEEILNHLPSNEREVLQAKEKNTEEIVRILTFRLSIKTEDKLHLWPYLRPLMASSYLDQNPPDANVCRHKALILRAVLNHLGISAKLVTGTVKGDSGPGEHVWVFLPQLQKVADPMNNLILPREDYDRLFEVRENFGIIHFAKPVGIMVR